MKLHLFIRFHSEFYWAPSLLYSGANQVVERCLEIKEKFLVLYLQNSQVKGIHSRVTERRTFTYNVEGRLFILQVISLGVLKWFAIISTRALSLFLFSLIQNMALLLLFRENTFLCILGCSIEPECIGFSFRFISKKLYV